MLFRSQRDAIRARNVQAFIKEATAVTDGLPGGDESDSAGATRSELELADGSVVPWNRASISTNDAQPGNDELPPNVTAMRHLSEGSSAAWQQLQKHHASVLQLRAKQHEYEKGDLETLNRELEQRRLGIRRAELDTRAVILDRAAEWMTLSDQLRALEKESRDTLQLVGQVEERFPQSTVLRDSASQILRQRQKELDDLQQPLRTQQAELQKTVGESPPSVKTAVERYWQTYAEAANRREEIQRLLQKLNDNLTRFTIHMSTAETPDVELRVADIVRAYPANGLTWSERCQVYVSRWWEFLSDEPREANSEGGVFPADRKSTRLNSSH